MCVWCDICFNQLPCTSHEHAWVSARLFAIVFDWLRKLCQCVCRDFYFIGIKNNLEICLKSNSLVKSKSSFGWRDKKGRTLFHPNLWWEKGRANRQNSIFVLFFSNSHQNTRSKWVTRPITLSFLFSWNSSIERGCKVLAQHHFPSVSVNGGTWTGSANFFHFIHHLFHEMAWIVESWVLSFPHFQHSINTPPSSHFSTFPSIDKFLCFYSKIC